MSSFLEYVSHDFIIDSHLMEKVLYYFRLFIKTDLHPCIKYGQFRNSKHQYARTILVSGCKYLTQMFNMLLLIYIGLS